MTEQGDLAVYGPRRRPDLGPNCRDLGGLPVRGGGCTRFGVLLRSGAVAHLSGDTAGEFGAPLRPRTFVDLRTASEIQRAGRADLVERTDVRICYEPMESDPGGARTALRPQPSLYAEAYHGLLPRALEVGARIVQLLRTGENHPLQFGCSVGKDRTGLVAAVLLLLAGARASVICADYALSARLLRPALDSFADEWRRKGLSRADYAVRLECVPSTMATVLAPLVRDHPTSGELARSLGISTDALAAFQRLFVTEPRRPST